MHLYTEKAPRHHKLTVWHSSRFTETKMSSIWRNFNHWLHWKLSFWQLPVQPVMKISSKWRHFRFSVIPKYSGFRTKRHIYQLYASVNWISIGSDNGLSPVRHQAFTWTNADFLLFGPLGTTVSEIRIEIQNFSFTKMHLNILSSAKWRPFSPGERS